MSMGNHDVTRLDGLFTLLDVDTPELTDGMEAEVSQSTAYRFYVD